MAWERRRSPPKVATGRMRRQLRDGEECGPADGAEGRAGRRRRWGPQRRRWRRGRRVVRGRREGRPAAAAGRLAPRPLLCSRHGGGLGGRVGGGGRSPADRTHAAPAGRRRRGGAAGDAPAVRPNTARVRGAKGGAGAAAGPLAQADAVDGAAVLVCAPSGDGTIGGGVQPSQIRRGPYGRAATPKGACIQGVQRSDSGPPQSRWAGPRPSPLC